MTKIILHTNRLKLRPVELIDTRILYKYRSDNEANKFQCFVPTSEVDMRNFIKKTSPVINKSSTWFQFVIISKEQNIIIGDIGIHFLPEDDFQVEFGITINKEYRNKGYATESIECVFDYLFTKLNKHRIIASVDPKNTDSIRLLERLKMRKEAHFVKSLFFKGEWVDDIIYALLKSESNKIYKQQVMSN